MDAASQGPGDAGFLFAEDPAGFDPRRHRDLRHQGPRDDRLQCHRRREHPVHGRASRRKRVARHLWPAGSRESPLSLGGGFKNFRPIQLVGAERARGRTAISAAIWSLPQTRRSRIIRSSNIAAMRPTARTVPQRAVPLQQRAADLYEYARAAMSKGGYAYNPVYEMEVTMGSALPRCEGGTREADARVNAGLVNLYLDLSKVGANGRIAICASFTAAFAEAEPGRNLCGGRTGGASNPATARQSRQIHSTNSRIARRRPTCRG